MPPKRKVLERARIRLRPNNVPDELPGRERECEQIYGKILRALRDNSGYCLFISGQTGTGKTVTVQHVMNKLKKEIGGMPVHFFKVNGIELSSPEDLYTILWNKLTGDNVNSTCAKKSLENAFKTEPERSRIVLTLDAIESIIEEKGQIIYNLLEWTSRPHVYFILVAITSDGDLADRLSDACNSRLWDKLIFNPYKRDELITIAKKLFKGIDIFDRNVIDLVSSKVSEDTQNIKTFISIFRTSIGILESNYKKNLKTKLVVTNEIVQKAIYSFGTQYKDFIKHCSVYEKIFLLAILAAKKDNQNDSSIQVKDVIPSCIRLCRTKFLKIPAESDMLNIAYNLATSSYITMDSSKDLYSPVNINGSEEDIREMLKNF